MKRGIVFTLLTASIAVFALLDDAEARRYYYRNYNRYYPEYYNFYRYPSTEFGIHSPFTRGRRPLNVPSSGWQSYRPYYSYYNYPQPAPFIPYLQPSPYIQPSVWSMPYSYLPALSMNYPFFPIQVISPAQPLIIERERVIVERQPPEAEPLYHEEVTNASPYSSASQIAENQEDYRHQLDMAQRFFRERNYRQAVEMYHRASGMNSLDAQMKMGQAFSLLAVGDYTNAASALRRALSLNPEWNEKPVLITAFYRETNDFDAHLTRLELYVRKNPQNLEARFLQAYLYVAADRRNDAAELLAGILASQPNDLDATTLFGRISASKK